MHKHILYSTNERVNEIKIKEKIHAAKLKQASFSDDTTTAHSIIVIVVVRRTGTENYKHNKMLGIKARRPTAVNTS